MEFKNLLNKFNVSIFDRIQWKQLHILDILVIKKDRHIETDLSSKPTDSLKKCLLFSSCHPQQTKTNIPFNMVRRICTIASSPQIRETTPGTCNYSSGKEILDRSITPRARRWKDNRLPRTTENEKISTVNTLSYVSTHNSRNMEAYGIICENIHFYWTIDIWPILSRRKKWSKVEGNLNPLNRLLKCTDLTTIITTSTIKNATTPISELISTLWKTPRINSNRTHFYKKNHFHMCFKGFYLCHQTAL